MNSRALLLSLAVTSLLPGCSGRWPAPPNLPTVRHSSTSVGAGDVFEVAVSGEKQMSREYRVQPNGTISFPRAGRLHVAGMQPQQIEELIRQRLIDERVLLDPQVTVVVKSYHSKKVSVIGAVQKPGSLPYVEGKSIVAYLSEAGWLTSLGDPNNVILTRVMQGGKTVSVRISIDAIREGKHPNIELYADDTVHINNKVF